jgi:hypothetical protein
MILTKLQRLWTLTEVPGWNVRFILCHWAAAVKNIPSTLKTWRKPAWKEDGDLHQDSIYLYSEMPGELNGLNVKNIDKQETLDEKARKAGL